MKRKKYFIGGLVNAVLPAIIPGLIGEIVGGESKKRAAQPQARTGTGITILAQEAAARHQKLKNIPKENQEIADKMNSQLASLFSIYPRDKQKDLATTLQDIIKYG